VATVISILSLKIKTPFKQQWSIFVIFLTIVRGYFVLSRFQRVFLHKFCGYFQLLILYTYIFLSLHFPDSFHSVLEELRPI